MSNPSVSVIIVSRKRPELLKRCLLAVSQLYYEAFEIIVVADQTGLDAIKDHSVWSKVKSTLCDVANISVARNLGLGLSSGEVIAFLDDDSAPEPGWLFHLARVFEDSSVDAAGGYVLGRNGITFASKAQTINIFGQTEPIEGAGTKPFARYGTEEIAIKTEGTNCAFRRGVFERIGGFDPGFSYFLDDSDLNVRMAKAGFKTAIVPLAQVHHATDQSERRLHNRLPKNLWDVGKSTAIFLRKHCPADQRALAWRDMQQNQRRQLVRQMLQGNCEPQGVERLMGSLAEGYRYGQNSTLTAPVKLTEPRLSFLQFSRTNCARTHRVFSGIGISVQGLSHKAVVAVKAGHAVTLYRFSPTALYHRVRFHPDGYWEQSGGLFGRSERTEKLFRWFSLKGRVAIETKRLALVRQPWNIESVDSIVFA